MKKTIIWLSVIFILLCLLLSFFLLNWEIKIYTESIPDKIEYNTKIGLPRSKLIGKYFLKDGIDIDTQLLTINNFSKTGKITNKYRAEYMFYSKEEEKVIEIVDTQKPEITLTTNKESFLFPGEEYKEEGFRAFDDYDGDISNKVISERKDNQIIYTVEDSSGNKAEVIRELKIDDPIKPEIKLKGKSEIKIFKGDKYSELGATATDNCDGDISDRIEIEGNVNNKKEGTYILNYKVKDNFNNEASITRTIIVVSKPKVEKPNTIPTKNKTIYLTFDDGPGEYTLKLLDILDKYNVKATFFVCDRGKYNYLIGEASKRGHSIGIHSVTHDYKTIYKNKDAFFKDMQGMQDIIYKETGKKSNILRFPGGSSNTVSRHYCEGIMSELTQDVLDMGFQYFDWNVSSGDAGETTKTSQVYKNVTEGISGMKQAVVLQHDIKGFSVNAVEDIIKWGLDNGYEFKSLDVHSYPAHHHVNN